MHNQSTTPTISVIVPVYNAEKYLRRCIDSVLAQTYTDFELLLIDDGSKDQSGEICDEYAIKDNRVRVVHKDNTGVSDTRNRGMDMAQGDYLMFLDADDFWIQADCMRLFLSKAKEYDLDIIRGEYIAVHEDGAFAWSRDIPKKRRRYADKVLTSDEFLEYGIHGEFFLWLSMIKKSILCNVRFEPDRVFLEDMLFYSSLLLKDLRCMYLPNLRFHAYRKNESSVSNRVSVKSLADSFSMCYRFHELASLAQSQRLKEKYTYYSVMMYYWTLDTVSSALYYSLRKTIIEDLSLVKLQHDIKAWISDGGMRVYNPIFYVSPLQGLRLLYVKRFLSMFKYRAKMVLKSMVNGCYR